MSQINLGGANAAVQLLGNDTITEDQQYTFPNTGGQLAVNVGNGVVPGYQQGEWTPTLSAGVANTQNTYTSQWSRVGQIVTVYGRVKWDGGPNPAAIIVDGLPYYPPADITDCGVFVGSLFNERQSAGLNGSAANNMVCYATAEGVAVYFASTALAYAQVSYSSFTNDSGSDGPGFTFSVSYRTEDTDWTPQNGATLT